MDYLQFSREFEKFHAKLRLPQNCIEPAPPTTIPVGFYFWRFEWQLIFKDDNKYLRIWERYTKLKGLDLSHRVSFAFHYGAVVEHDNDGLAVRDSQDPVDIRIDNINGPAHLHYQAPKPHIPQASVEGLNLEALDMFTFVKAIILHRKSGKPIDQILGFRIR